MQTIPAHHFVSIYHLFSPQRQIKKTKNNMPLKQSLLAFIATILFSMAMASMDTANIAALAANASPSPGTTSSANNTSVIRDPVSNSQSQAQPPLKPC